jgi:GR25 family glycosyltransferase involved in LPS biosynthesis
MQAIPPAQLTLNSYFDKIFYINLAKDISRNENMIAQFQKFGITNYERIDAIALTEIPAFDQYRNFIKNEQKYIIGNLACRASHLKTIKIAKERGYKSVMIFEDDAHFLEDPNFILWQSQRALYDWDMLYFGGLIEQHFRNQIVCAHAYAVKNTIYDDLIFLGENSGMEIDNFYAKIIHHMSYNYNQSGKYNIHITSPFNQIVQEKSFGSNIQAH